MYETCHLILKAIARDPKVVLVDEPFAGLTLAEVGSFSELIRSFRDEGRAVLLVDHNVKSVAALVDRVLAMYLGEEIVTGRAEDVMRNESAPVYLGGAIERRPARRPASKKNSLAPGRERQRLLRQGSGAGKCLHPCPSGRIRLGRRAERSGENHAVQHDFGLPSVHRRNCPRRRKTARHRPARIARSGIVQCPESRELFGEMSVRENLDLGGQHLSDEKQGPAIDVAVRAISDPEGAAEPDGADVVRRRTADAGDRPRADDAAEILILDEPTLGLAPVILEQLSKALERLRQTTPITVLLGEQNVTFALPHADRVYVLEHARIVWEGDPGRFAEEAGEGYL